MSKKYKILVVDDDVSIIKVISRILADEPYEIFSAYNPTEAFPIIEKEDLDLILADFHMGELTGVDVFQKAVDLKKKTAMILMTGTPNSPMPLDLLKELGVFKLILKPWDVEFLKKTLREALGANSK